MSTPALSVILSVYNGERFLAEAVESILAQTFADFEFIIIDDGSRDGSGAIIADYAARDSRIRAFHQDNRGLADALNYGISLARAPLIARMDADDISLPQRFALQIDRFQGRADLAVLGSFVVLIDDIGTPIRLVDFPTGGAGLLRFLELDCPLSHPTVVMRRDVISNLGGYRRQYKFAQDYDLWLRVADAGYAIENMVLPVLRYRQHDENVSLQHREQQMLMALVARLAHRARVSGLADPTDHVAAIDESTIALFTPAVIGNIDAELFVRRNNLLSLADIETIEQTLYNYSQLPAEIQRDPYMTYFLMRAARGFWTQGRRSKSLSLVARTLVRHPEVVLTILLERLRRAKTRATARICSRQR